MYGAMKLLTYLSLHARSKGACVVLGACLAAAAHAAIPVGSSNVQIGGFFSQGYLYSSDNNYPTADKGGTWDFREMAFNASTTVGDHLRIGGQVFAQRQVFVDHVVLECLLETSLLDPTADEQAGGDDDAGAE